MIMTFGAVIMAVMIYSAVRLPHGTLSTDVPSPPPLPQVRVDHRNGTLHFGGQQLESEKVRSHLAVRAGRLSKAVTMIDGPAAVPEDKAAKRLAAIKAALEATKEEHKLMNARKVCVGRRMRCYVG